MLLYLILSVKREDKIYYPVKTFRKQLQKVSNAIHNALSKIGLDLGTSAARDIKYAQDTVDAWLDAMTTAISNAQKRREQQQAK